MCRLCLQETYEFSFLLDQAAEETRELFVKLEQLFEISNFENEALPGKICKECELKTNDFYEFWLRVKENQTRLQTLDFDAFDEFQNDEEEIDGTNIVLIGTNHDHAESEEPNDVLKMELEDNDYEIETLEPQHEEFVEASQPNQQSFRNIVVVQNRPKKGNQTTLFECDTCQQLFKTRRGLKSHLATAHRIDDDTSDEQESKYKPLKRPTKTKTRAEIDEEDRIIRDFFDLTCNLCEDSPRLEFLASYKNHMRVEHGVEKPFVECCGKKLYEKRKILGHAILHTDPDSLKCKICGRQCISRPRLQEHMFDYHNPNGLRFKCDKCPRSYATNSALKHHESTHFTEEEKERQKQINKCQECGQGFVTRTILICHIRNTHMKVGQSVCDHCAKVFGSKQALKIHYDLKHSENPPEKKQCPICCKWMPGERFLTKHINRIHKKKEGVNSSCHMCGKTLSSENHLKKHIENVHSAKPKYPCPHCDKAFRWPMGLKEHMTIHTGGKPLYQCSFCEKSCNSNANMLKHKKQMHAEKYEEERRNASVNNPGWARLNVEK